jgi:hypothetical protein
VAVARACQASRDPAAEIAAFEPQTRQWPMDVHVSRLASSRVDSCDAQRLPLVSTGPLDYVLFTSHDSPTRIIPHLVASRRISSRIVATPLSALSDKSPPFCTFLSPPSTDLVETTAGSSAGGASASLLVAVGGTNALCGSAYAYESHTPTKRHGDVCRWKEGDEA